jgi:hypothetical protein
MNPFEIRAQLLAMSKDYLDKQFEVNTEFTKRAFEDVVEHAKKLYGFVNSK